MDATLRDPHACIYTPSICVAGNRLLVWDALSPLGPGRVFGGFAIFFWAKLPDSCRDTDDKRVVEWLVQVII